MMGGGLFDLHPVYLGVFGCFGSTKVLLLGVAWVDNSKSARSHGTIMRKDDDDDDHELTTPTFFNNAAREHSAGYLPVVLSPRFRGRPVPP